MNKAYQEAIVMDTMGSWTMRRPTAGRNEESFIDQALNNGLSVMSETIVADTDIWEWRTVLRWFDDFHWMISRFPDKMLLVETTEDILRAKREKKLGYIAMFQGANAIFEDLAMLRPYHRLGLRTMSLTYMRGNALGGGCQEPNDFGLTSFGKRVVAEMNRIGVAVDLSHVGYKTAMDAIKVSNKPVICTHSNIRAVTNHFRNLPDDEIKAIAETGGVIAITPVAIFCCDTSGKRPTVDNLINHIEYVIDKAGIDHVGISTDRLIGNVLDEQVLLSKAAPDLFTFSGLTGKHAEGFSDFTCWPKIGDRLKERGYRDEEIKKILGGNFIRVFKEIWGA